MKSIFKLGLLFSFFVSLPLSLASAFGQDEFEELIQKLPPIPLPRVSQKKYDEYKENFPEGTPLSFLAQEIVMAPTCTFDFTPSFQFGRYSISDANISVLKLPLSKESCFLQDWWKENKNKGYFNFGMRSAKILKNGLITPFHVTLTGYTGPYDDPDDCINGHITLMPTFESIREGS